MDKQLTKQQMPQHQVHPTVKQKNGDDEGNEFAWSAGEGGNEHTSSPAQAQQQH